MYHSISHHGMALLLAVMIISLLGTLPVHAQDGLMMNYQGYLTDASGGPVTGPEIPLTFTIYDAGGVSKWSEEHPGVAVDNGLFSVILGSQTDLPDSVFNGAERYLGIAVGGDAEMSPRILLASSPGAAVSRRLVGDIHTGPGAMVIMHAGDDSAIVFMASGDTHVMRIAPPDPCAPPEPCTPAIELVADVEVHSMKIHPPDPCDPAGPCLPAIELTASSTSGAGINFNNEIGKVMGVEPSPFYEGYAFGFYDPETDETLAKLHGNYFTGESGLAFSIPSDRDLLTMNAAPATGASLIMFNPQPAPPGGIGIEITTNSAKGPGGNVSVFDTDSIRTSLSGGLIETGRLDVMTSPRTALMANTEVASLTLTGDGAFSAPPQIVMLAGSDGARVCIGTSTPIEALTVMGSGWFSGDLYYLTDTKVKRNVVPIDNALDKVSRVNGYYYECRTDEYPELKMQADRQIGFLAQEVADVVPEAVKENDRGLTGVSYGRLTALLVEAVKELKAENEELRARVEQLERR